MTPSHIRRNNRQQILNALRKGARAIPELAEELGLSPTAVANIINDLLQYNIISASGNKNTRAGAGRKASVFSLNSAYGAIILIEFASNYEHDYYRIFACDINENVLQMKTIPPIVNESDNRLTELILAGIDELLESPRVKGLPLLNICIAAPGIIDEETGLLVATCLKKYDGEYNLKEILESAYHVPIHIRGLLSSAAKAELKKGAFAGGCKLGILMNIDSGIGMSFLMGEKPFTGAHGFAGEIGFLTSNLTEGYHKSLSERVSSGLGDEISVETIKRNVRTRKGAPADYSNQNLLEDFAEKDEIVIQEIINNAYKVGSFLKNVVLLLDPETIVISGLITRFGDFYHDILNGCLSTGFRDKTKIVFSELEDPIYEGLLDTAVLNVFQALD